MFADETLRKFGLWVVSAVLVFAVTGGASAQGNAAAVSGSTKVTTSQTAKPEAKDEEESGAQPNTGNQQGIKVHGHWIIDVRNPDGTLVEHRDIQNSMVDTGYILSNLLAGTISGGEPYLELMASNNGSPCTTQIRPCFFYTNPKGAAYTVLYGMGSSQLDFNLCSYSNCFTGLQSGPAFIFTSLPTQCPAAAPCGFYALQLSEQFTATATSNIATVASYYAACVSPNAATGAITTISPSSCATQTPASAFPVFQLTTIDRATSQVMFTQKTLATPIAVTAGQIVQVTLQISFS